MDAQGDPRPRAARGALSPEIGAGDPLVADLLARLGYDVVVVDPYDGRDGGPEGFDVLRARYPGLRFDSEHVS